ncbi:hypothetical protein CASFOL_012038 [Castilleja foliolosa]|uniref:DUF4408 domain-containing protein n=1 Tax=Castilleja foliolosa TaxID=1961234 RepID=A0ABD3DPA2_9LAMI
MLSKNAHNHDHQYYYQSLKLLIVTLLVVTPLLSSSFRFKYLYFIVNILIIAIGAEAGLVSFFLRSKKPCFTDNENIKNLFTDKESVTADHGDEHQSVNTVFVEGVNKEADIDEKIPSIFFIGGGDQTENINVATDQELIMDDEELFQKAEIFIGNFYKQLKMQREESRRRLADQ